MKFVCAGLECLTTNILLHAKAVQNLTGNYTTCQSLKTLLKLGHQKEIYCLGTICVMHVWIVTGYISEFQIRHILTGGSRSFGYESTWKRIKIQNVKAEKSISNASNHKRELYQN